MSDSLSRSADDKVKRAVPRLERALERAVSLAEATLRYGRADAQPAKMQRFRLAPIADEALREGLSMTSVDWLVDIEDELEVTADPDHLHRILAICRAMRGRRLLSRKNKMAKGWFRFA